MAYSQDLRERVVRAVERGDRDRTQREVAEDFGVSLSYVEEAWRDYRETGRWALPGGQTGRPARLSGQAERLRAEVAAQPDVLLSQLCERVPAADGRPVSPSVMSRTLKRLKLTRKKRASTPASGTRSG